MIEKKSSFFEKYPLLFWVLIMLVFAWFIWAMSSVK
jgi:hypothetical protein